ncbi:MAG TPA: hypothetical protein VM143_12205 [Acidimicrobiales bacterium]|nr:hypothetical protein [Acidimicrobiales bacterium]
MAVVGLMVPLVMGGESRTSTPLVVALLGATVVGLLVVRRRIVPRPLERGWSLPTTTTTPTAAPTSTRDPAPSGWAVARALGRVECRQLVQSPWFGVGVGFCVLLLVLFGFVFSSDNGDTWDGYFQLAPWLAHPLVGMTVLASYRAATRARRDGAQELLDTCPADPTARTGGLLLSAVVPVVVLTALLLLLTAATFFRSPNLYGPVNSDNAADVLGAVALGLGGVALGTALGHWVRFGLAPVAALVVVQMLTVRINSIGDPGWNPFAPLSTAPALSDYAPIFTDRPAWTHALWILALSAVVGVIAVTRHRRDRIVLVAGALAVLVASTAAVSATRPPRRAAQIADLVVNPTAHSSCAQAARVRVCAYAPYTELRDRFVERIGPVDRALPAGLPSLTLRQRFNGEINDLPPKVRRLAARAHPLGEGEMRLPFGASDHDLDDTALRIALASVGLPAENRPDKVPRVIAGQARGVIALWLTTRGLDSKRATNLATSRDPGSPDAFDRGSPDKDPCNSPSVTWSAQDLAAARTLIALPETKVERVVGGDWAKWIDPATKTDDLMAALGLPSVGPIDDVQPRPVEHC